MHSFVAGYYMVDACHDPWERTHLDAKDPVGLLYRASIILHAANEKEKRGEK